MLFSFISAEMFYMNCTQKIFIDIFSPWKNKCLLNEDFFFFFFADFSPKFIRTKRSYLQLVGNTSSSSQNSISSLSGMNHNDMQLDNQYLEKRWSLLHFVWLLQFSPLIVAVEFYPMTQYHVIVFCIRTQLNGKTTRRNSMRWLKSTEKCWRI